MRAPNRLGTSFDAEFGENVDAIQRRRTLKPNGTPIHT
jgi:hypothetical protein